MSKNLGLGAIPSPKDERDYSLEVMGLSIDPSAPLKPYKLGVKGELPVYNQENTSQCVDYATITIKQAIYLILEGKIMEFAHGFIYGNRRNMYYKGEGLILRDALKSVVQDGVVPKENFTGGKTAIECITAVNEKLSELLYTASGWKSKTYIRMSCAQEIVYCFWKYKIPVLAAFKVYSSIFGTQSNGIVPEPSGAYLGNHAVALDEVLYYGDIPYYGFQNSWGKEWGNKGFGSIRIEEVYEAWALINDVPLLERLEPNSVMIDVPNKSMKVFYSNGIMEEYAVDTEIKDGRTMLEMRSTFNNALKWEQTDWNHIQKIATFRKVRTKA